MFSYVMLGVMDMQVLKKFYDVILGVLGYELGVMDDKGCCFYYIKIGVFVFSVLINGELVCNGNGSIIGFVVKILELVDVWYVVGLENGGVICEDLFGICEGNGVRLYIVYLCDFFGNKICVLYWMG